MQGQNNSEVARLMAQITAEYEAAQHALHGMAAGVARHSFINTRMEHIGMLKNELADKIGDTEAMAVICKVMMEEQGACNEKR